MSNFPFNQPNNKECGYRCLYYIISPNQSYETWLDNFKFFNPKKSGINFNDICEVLKFHGIACKFTELTEQSLYLVYSGIWLKHGHYFLYDKGVVYCSTKSEPYRMPLNEVIAKLEAQTTEQAFRCLKVG